MSLLMKALKKAEESQQGSQKESEPTLRELAEELSLEPGPETPAAKKNPPVEKPAGVSAGQHDAANLFAAKESPHAGNHRLIVAFFLAALLLLAGGGVYVYIAINKPGLLMSARPPSPLPSAMQPVPQAGNQLPQAHDAPPVAGALPELFEAKPESFDRLRPTQNMSLPAISNASPSGVEQESAIKVRRGGLSEVDPELAQGYQSLQEGRLEAAKMRYQRLLQQEPRNVDALLGMAAVETRSNNMSEAGKLYFRALDVEPKNLFAQAGLLNLLGSSDPAGSEAKFKQLLAEKQAGFLHFALGNLYAVQKRWHEAQQSYFQAYHLESDNPDYAFNLAVSLEQIGQPKPALTYYQRALQLQGQRSANFEHVTVEARIAQLQKMAE